MTNVLMIGAFDTKGGEYAFLRERLLAGGVGVTALNFGVMGTTDLFAVDFQADEVARAGGGDLDQLRTEKDRGKAMKVMSEGATALVRRLFEQGRFDGIIGMGGTGGTSVITAAMRGLPLGVPKICVTTAISNAGLYVGISDVVLIPSIVDVAGVNRISRLVMTRAAGAMCGMAQAKLPEAAADRPIIAATMFGNTTACVDACRETLEKAGYEVLVFHATGIGGRTMEMLVENGLVDGVLDITTTEWADEICEGAFSAGPERLSAAGLRGIPQLVSPGCIDMVNFGAVATVPEKYRGRKLYEWNPSVTLMRTNAEENQQMGEIFAKKLNAAKGPVGVLIPLRGVSILDGDGQAFCDREADGAMFEALKRKLREDIPVVEMDVNINDPAFSNKAVEMMLGMMERKES